MSIYLDYNASAPIDYRVLDKMIDVYKNYIGNADSRTHDYGDKARNIVEHARKETASLLGVTPSEIFFTSGATESNNIAIQGLWQYAKKTGKNHIITTSIEHKAVLETILHMSRYGFDVDIISPNVDGKMDVNKVLNMIRKETLLVCMMHVNNETGMIQPVAELGDELKKRNILFHIDATQSCGKLVDEIKCLSYSTLAISAHKFQGPQGVGALVLRRSGYKLPPVKPIMFGGQQENGIRPGTIPVALVAGCGEACKIAQEEYSDNNFKLNIIKKKVLSIFEESDINYNFNGDQNYCIDNTINVCLPGVVSEALLLSTKQYCSISNGSACTTKSYSPSYVLTSMGLTPEDAECSIRISWGPQTNEVELKKGIQGLLSTAMKFV